MPEYLGTFEQPMSSVYEMEIEPICEPTLIVANLQHFSDFLEGERWSGLTRLVSSDPF